MGCCLLWQCSYSFKDLNRVGKWGLAGDIKQYQRHLACKGLGHLPCYHCACACFSVPSWNRSAAAENREKICLPGKEPCFLCLESRPPVKLKRQLSKSMEWMAQRVVTVQASSLDTASSGIAVGKGHLCAPTLGSSRLEIFSEASGSWWESEPVLLVLGTAVP